MKNENVKFKNDELWCPITKTRLSQNGRLKSLYEQNKTRKHGRHGNVNVNVTGTGRCSGRDVGV